MVARNVPNVKGDVSGRLSASEAFHFGVSTTRQNLALLSRINTRAFVCIGSLFAVLGLLALLGFFGLADAGFEEKLFIGGPFLLGAFISGLTALHCEHDLRGIEEICPACGHDQGESSPDAKAEN